MNFLRWNLTTPDYRNQSSCASPKGAPIGPLERVLGPAQIALYAWARRHPNDPNESAIWDAVWAMVAAEVCLQNLGWLRSGWKA